VLVQVGATTAGRKLDVTTSSRTMGFRTGRGGGWDCRQTGPTSLGHGCCGVHERKRRAKWRHPAVKDCNGSSLIRYQARVCSLRRFLDRAAQRQGGDESQRGWAAAGSASRSGRRPTVEKRPSLVDFTSRPCIRAEWPDNQPAGGRSGTKTADGAAAGAAWGFFCAAIVVCRRRWGC